MWRFKRNLAVSALRDTMSSEVAFRSALYGGRYGALAVMPWKSVLKILTVPSFKDSKGGSEVPVFVLLPFRSGRGSTEHNYLIEPSRFIKLVLVALSYLLPLLVLRGFAYVMVMRQSKVLSESTILKHLLDLSEPHMSGSVSR